MKRFLILFIITALVFPLFSCSQNNSAHILKADVLSGVSDTPPISAEKMELSLKNFLNVTSEHPDGDIGPREPFSESEKKAADYIKTYAESFKDGDESVYKTTEQSFEINGEASQNIIVNKKGTGSEGKQVIIGTYYDNLISSVTPSLNGKKSEATAGAMENGTGCALLLALLDYFKTSSFSFDLEFVFFGASNPYNYGAGYYVSKMPQVKIDNTLLMLSLRRFGGDSLYLYTEEVKTAHHEFIKSKAKEQSAELLDTPSYLPVVGTTALTRMPYATWASMGVHSPFFFNDINVANIYSASYDFFFIGDNESGGAANRSNTENDTYRQLVSDFPRYSAQMSEAAQIVIATLSDADFAQTMLKSWSGFKSYEWAVNKLWGLISVVFIIIALAVLLIVLVKKFEKKYPHNPRKVNVKIAVFGREYEEKSDADIIIDIKKPQDPFEP